MKFAVVGDSSVPGAAVQEALRDAVSERDELFMVWVGPPVSEAMEEVYGYSLDEEIRSTLFYTDEQAVVPPVFRDADNIDVVKTRDPIGAVCDVAPDTVLFLWDDDAPNTQALIERVFDTIAGVTVLELSNGLAPIVLEDEDPEVSEARSQPAPHEEQEEDEDDTTFTKAELENATAYVVKRYGEKMGCDSKTKAGIIAELFPDGETADAPMEEGVVYGPPVPEDLYDDLTTSGGCERALLVDYRRFLKSGKPGYANDLAQSHLAQAVYWMRKAL